MKNAIFALFLAFSCQVALASNLTTTPTPAETNGIAVEVQSPEQLAQERLVLLPEDGDKLYITVFGTGARYQRVLGWFETDPVLKAAAENTHFHKIDTRTALYRDRYAKLAPITPAVLVQMPNGDVLYRSQGASLVAPNRLADSIVETVNAESNRWRKDRQSRPSPSCPWKGAEPEPSPVAPARSIGLATLCALAFALGSAIGLVSAYREEHSRK